MLVFYTWLKEVKTGIVSATPIITDYFIGDIGEVIKNDQNEEFIVTDYAVENYPEGV